jgi:hypothetical protein
VNIAINISKKILKAGAFVLVVCLITAAIGGAVFGGLALLSKFGLLSVIPERGRTLAYFWRTVIAGAMIGVPMAGLLAFEKWREEHELKSTERAIARAGIASEEFGAFLERTRPKLFKGAIIGGVAASVACWSGIIPMAGYYEWFAMVMSGVMLGVLTAVASHRSPIASAADDVASASIYGFLIGGGIGFAGAAAIIWVARGTYVAGYNETWGLVGGGLGVAIAAWQRCASLDLYPRTRLILGFFLSACTGAGLLAASMALGADIAPLGQFWRAVVKIFNVTEDAVLWRSGLLAGALLGSSVYAWWRFGRYRLSFRDGGSSAASIVGEVATSVGNIAAFIHGALWIVAAVVIWRVGSWWWATVESGSTSEIVGYVIFGGSVLAFVKGVQELRTALKGTLRLRNRSAQSSRVATESEGAQAARGESPSRTSLDQQNLSY